MINARLMQFDPKFKGGFYFLSWTALGAETGCMKSFIHLFIQSVTVAFLLLCWPCFTSWIPEMVDMYPLEKRTQRAFGLGRSWKVIGPDRSFTYEQVDGNLFQLRHNEKSPLPFLHSLHNMPTMRIYGEW